MPGSLSEFERLFLLEFYVDYVTIQNIAFDFEESKLCVSFQFLHYPVMRVCEEDFKPTTSKPVTEDSKIVFKSGKSCMFSVHPDENNTISSSFNLIIAVCQRREGCTQRELIGQATVNLGASFLNLLQPAGNFTMNSGAKHDLFPLKDKFKRTVGSVAAFARLSNFGKMIVTQFQLAEEGDLNYMFKGTDPAKLFKDDPAMRDFPIIKNDEPRPSMEQKQRTSRPSALPRRPAPRYVPESDDDDSCDDSDETDSCKTDSTEATEKEIDQVTADRGDAKQPGDGGNFREIGAEINGHSITIRVVKKDKILPVPEPPPCCCPPEPPICPFAPQLNLCECDYPLPPELIPRCPAQCCCCGPGPSNPANQPPNPANQTPNIASPLPNLSIPPSNSPVSTPINEMSPPLPTTSEQDNLNSMVPVCPREDCPLGLYVPSPPPDPMELEPGCVAMKGDQVFFQMVNRPSGEPVNEKEKKLASSLYYTLGTTEGGKDTMGNVVQITPQGAKEPLSEGIDGPVSGLPLDSRQDMFLFKVLQQSDNVSTKCKLEMELRTPKEKFPKPDSSTIDTQYLLTDLPPVEKKGKKGKKGDKGGKGGKGGKKGGKKGKK